MIIGIDASRAFLKRRTGIEEYSYQVIKHLQEELQNDEVVLYVRKKLEIGNGKLEIRTPEVDFDLPANWKIRSPWAPRFWTQVRLSLEMLFHPPDVLFVPAHTVPLIHPARTIVTVHGLEYEVCPKAYSFWGRLYMRHSIRFSCRVAEKIIVVSKNTKKDLMHLYRVPEGKIAVVYEGYAKEGKGERVQGREKKGENASPSTLYPTPYLLFIGRLEERKNVVRMIEAFEILKEKYHIPHQLVLAGKPGYGYGKVKVKRQKSKVGDDIIELGYISEEEKWALLQNADIFLFPSLYEGFGLPILEAQSAGVPVVTSRTSSLPEVGGEGAVYVDPLSSESIARGIQSLLSDKGGRGDIIRKGRDNAPFFTWEKCAASIALLLKG